MLYRDERKATSEILSATSRMKLAVWEDIFVAERVFVFVRLTGITFIRMV